jgi:hypothetical protein
MAEKKSKTNVAARSESKKRVQLCRYCGNKVEIILAVASNGKRKMKRLCCGV